MKTDYFCATGSNHFICEDYAMSGENFIVVTDGCSSAPQSDWGSRLLANTIKVFLQTNSIDLLDTEVFNKLPELCVEFDIPSLALCATFIAVQKQDNLFKLRMMGDGAYVGFKKDGTLDISVVEFSTNAPYYAYYAMHPESHQKYCDNFGDGDVCITNYQDTVPVNKTLPVPYFFTPHCVNFDVEEYDAVAIFTDGFKSFTKAHKTATSNTTTPVAELEILKQILDIHNYTGNFLQRKCLFDFRLFKKREYSHYDDFSVALIKEN